MKVPRLRRITSSGRFIPEIDGLRFIAIASVVLYHLQWVLLNRFGASAPEDWLTRTVHHGSRGVPLFFTISGFILALPFAGHHLAGRPAVSLKKYFLRRVTRLEPPYILNLLFLFALEVAHHPGSVRELLSHLGASLVYLHNLIYGTGSTINGVAWSLEVEIQFYFLVPLLTGVFAIRHKHWRRGLILGIMLAAALAQWFWLADSPRLERSILNYVQSFLAGFLLADVYLADWREKPAKHWVWDAVSLAGWPAMFFFEGTAFNIGMPFLSLLLYVATFRSTRFNRLLTHPAITSIGGMCYTLYLFHYFLLYRVLLVSSKLGAGLDFHWYLLLQALLAAPVVLGACAVYFLLIERPCMSSDWPRRAWAFLRNRGTTRQPVTTAPEPAIMEKPDQR